MFRYSTMSEKEDILKIYYEGVTQRFRIEINFLNKLIRHTAEIGTANENSLINLLVKFLPKLYSVGGGVIIDKEGNRSNQIDIVVYDSHYHPELFSHGSAVLYPVDVVYMTIEVKTTITKDIMKEAIKNTKSLAPLWLPRVEDQPRLSVRQPYILQVFAIGWW
jgi:hypothetical protein